MSFNINYAQFTIRCANVGSLIVTYVPPDVGFDMAGGYVCRDRGNMAIKMA